MDDDNFMFRNAYPKTTLTRRTERGAQPTDGLGAGVARYWNVTAARARLTLATGHTVTGPGGVPGAAILVPWPGWLRICSPAAFDTLTAPSIRSTPSA